MQAGSFSQKHLATNLYDRLSKFGQGEVTPVDVNGSTFYRVKIGPFSYQEEADIMLGKIRDYGIYDARIVKN